MYAQHASMYVCMYVCMYLCIYVCIYMHTLCFVSIQHTCMRASTPSSQQHYGCQHRRNNAQAYMNVRVESNTQKQHTVISVAMSLPAQRKRACGSSLRITHTSPGTQPAASSPSHSKMNCVAGRMPGITFTCRWHLSVPVCEH